MLPAIIEVLDHGRDGEPRVVRCEVPTASAAAALARAVSAAGAARGYVVMRTRAYLRLASARVEALAERTLLLLDMGEDTSTHVALTAAAAAVPRPHVLIAIRAAEARPGAGIVREARPHYSAPPLRPDTIRYVQQAARAAEYARAGRHAAAERVLRECAAALSRRGAAAATAHVYIALARLLLERGRVVDAERACVQAARHATAGEDGDALMMARVWQASARTDAGRLSDAESICRAVLLGPDTASPAATLARAALVRVLLAQSRCDDLERADLALNGAAREALGAETSAFVDGVAVRAALTRAAIFEAGQRMRAGLDAATAAADPLATAIAATTQLRVLAAIGDLAAAAQAFDAVRAAARHAHAPLRIARARLIWHDALMRGARAREAERHLASLVRIAHVLPPRLQGAVRQRQNAAARPGGRTLVPPPLSPVATLVRLAHEEEDDASAVRTLLETVARELRTTRMEVASHDAGPVSAVLSLGSGLPTQLGARVLDAGITIGPERVEGGVEVGVPVRLGPRLLAALVARWSADRSAPAGAAERLEVAAAVAAPRLDAQLASARVVAAAATAVPELVGVSDAMDAVRRAIVRAAGAPFTVLIEGESGVGKELVARAIHQLSPRRERRLCDVNCAALTEELLDAELFGHARGAFTGAVADRPGLFEVADGGTLFLDEVADLSLRAQAKLLRVLQQQEVRRVGETFTRKVDVRLVAAANRDMREEVTAGRFRQDLLYRLDVIRIHIPSLRDRPADIAILAEHFWRAAAARVSSSARLTHGVLAALTRYHWPGNVRELQNVTAALAVAAPARGRVAASLLPPAIAGVAAGSVLRLAEARHQFERRCVEVALAQAAGNRTRAAAQLGLSRQGLLKTMSRLGIERARV